MGTMASQSTSLTIVHSTVYSGADQRKHQSSASMAFVRGIRHTNDQYRGKCFHLMTSSCTNAATDQRTKHINWYFMFTNSLVWPRTSLSCPCPVLSYTGWLSLDSDLQRYVCCYFIFTTSIDQCNRGSRDIFGGFVSYLLRMVRTSAANCQYTILVTADDGIEG